MDVGGLDIEYDKADDFKPLSKPLSYELEILWPAILKYIDSSMNQNQILPNSGGYNDQPDFFWECVGYIETTLGEWKVLHE